MKKYLLLVLLLLAFGAKAQTVFKGEVIDQNTKEKLAGITIYINNSSIGTTTNSEGKFTLSVPFSGKMELVISHVSYQKKNIIIESNQTEPLVISLKPQDNTLNEVVVKANKNKSGGFDKWGAIFTRLLMGNDGHFVAGCRIRNPQVLVFYFDQEANELSVYARSPLIIENSLTNYRLKMDFDTFNYSFNNYLLRCTYSTFFEEMENPRNKKEDINNWRHMAYYGSQMHLMRCIYRNDLTRNGYKVFLYKSVKNVEKERVTKIIQQKLNENSITQSTVVFDIAKLFKNRDTVYYYKMISKQDDILKADTTFSSIRMFSKLDRAQAVAKFYAKDSLMFDYQRNLDLNNKSVKPEQRNKWRASEDKAKSKGLTTIFFFTSNEGVSIESTGYFPETGLFSSGDMFDRRISQLLPWDYDPDKD